MLGLGVLAVQRIEAERSTATSARELVEDARRQRDIAAVYAPAQLEQIALEGLAAIDALGLPRDLVVTVAGVDLETMYNQNVEDLDGALDRLTEQHGDFVLDDGTILSDRISFTRGELASQRHLSNEERAHSIDIGAVFAGLDLLLADAVASTPITTVASSTPSPSDDRVSLGALSEVLVTAGDRGTALLAGLLDQTPETAADILAANARLDYAIEQFSGLLDADQTALLQKVTDDLQPVPASLLSRGEDESIAVEFDAQYIEDSAGALLAQLGFLAALESYSSDFHSDVVSNLEASAVTAENAALRTQLLVAVTATVSLVILALLSWSTLRPLRRLTKRARSISHGSFDEAPLPVRGPSDVRTLTSTMNSMAATLRAVDREIADLASGASAERADALPGAIGVSLHQSFQRLETMTERLHESEQLASAIVAQAADAIWTVDEHGIITSANDASVALLEIPATEQVGEPLRMFLPRTTGEMDVYRSNGASTRVVVASSDIDGGARPLTAVIAHDISERTRFEERLAYQAHHDALTGLPNRFAVLEALSASDPDKSLAVLFVDLDGFKSVNDTQGHLAGDRVLTEVGRRLSSHMRPGDFVGRLGGDEFVVLMHDPRQTSDAVAFGYRIIDEIEQPYRDEEHLFALSASVGVATFPDGLTAEGLSALDAIRRADGAVYAAKQRGRGRVEVFDANLQQRIVHDAEIELALRDAVRNNELELHLQPVYEVAPGRFTGAEALVRWNRPGVGMVPPGDFIPVAEKSSLIDEIGRWVLAEACTTLARWNAQPALHDVKIAVNIAGSHLLDGDLISDLDAALLLSGADPHLIEFELTETQIVDDHERAATILREIRRRGVTVAIDDFGTGYSSMAYLRELPIDTLKIDRSFVAPLAHPDAETTVLDALVTIGHSLGLSVVAEGIEEATQYDYLTARGCDRLQGFHLARPVPIADAEALIIGSAAVHEPARSDDASLVS